MSSITPITFFVILIVACYFAFGSLLETSSWVTHTHNVIAKASHLEKLVVDLETGQRGYLFTGNEAFLGPYNNAVVKINRDLDDLKTTVSDNPSQVENLEKIGLLINKWLNEAGNITIEKRRELGSEAYLYQNLESTLKKKQGKQIMDRIRAEIDAVATHFGQRKDFKGQLLAQRILESMIDMETGQRGFLMSGTEEFLEPYYAGERMLETAVKDLREYSAENASSSQINDNIQNIKIMADSWMREVATPEINSRREVNRNEEVLLSIRQMVESQNGRNTMNSILSELNSFKEEEYRLLNIRQNDAANTVNWSRWLIIIGSIFTVLISIVISSFINLNIGQSLRKVVDAVKKIEKDDYSIILNSRIKDDIGTLSNSINTMTLKLKEKYGMDWVKTNLNKITSDLQGIYDLTEFANVLITKAAPIVGGQLGVVYMKDLDDGEEIFTLTASYAYRVRKDVSSKFKAGESLVGQCALEKKTIVFTNVPDNYVHIQSGIGQMSPKFIILVPIIFEAKVVAVIEIGSTEEFTHLHQSFLDQLAMFSGLAMDGIINRVKTEELLKETLSNSMILQNQQEELKVANEELEEQTLKIKESEKKLQTQAEELKATNEELEEKTENLQRQNKEIEAKSKQINTAKDELEQKANALVQSNKYKSEFLANISHELRTPLNSLLILSKSLAENRKNHLDEEEVECAQIVHEGGHNLLNLINDILDLAKVEEGKMSLHYEDLNLHEFSKRIERQFLPMAKEKNLNFNVSIDENAPGLLKVDSQKTEQILRNIVGNAIKFTSEGYVKIRIYQLDSHKQVAQGKAIAFEVKDSGAGISEEKQKDIFEAFQQEDGSTSRKYGGTGLGLTISRKMSALMGGGVGLQSTKGEGSTFTLFLPVIPPDSSVQMQEPRGKILPINSLNTSGDKQEIHENVPEKSPPRPTSADQRVMLIIEDDVRFSKILGKIVERQGFKCIYAYNGIEGLNIARKELPNAIILDVNLPGMDGPEVLQNLKSDNNTHQIPVQIISASENLENFLDKGAFGFLKKPVNEEDIRSAILKLEQEFDTTIKNILLIENDPMDRKIITKTMQNPSVELSLAKTGKEGLNLIKNNIFHTIILDLSLPDMTGFEFLDALQNELDIKNLPPIIVYTAQELSETQIEKIEEYSQRIILKGSYSLERLLDETMLFLHSVKSGLNESESTNTKIVTYPDKTRFKGETILLVDDDMKNTFALSKILRDQGLKVIQAGNGKQALEKLDANKEISLILMDIMMPVMDGYEAMTHIRKKPGYENLPIISLTAKAMPEDRIKCMKAGANDYLSKPIDVDKLMSLIEIWIKDTNLRTTA